MKHVLYARHSTRQKEHKCELDSIPALKGLTNWSEEWGGKGVGMVRAMIDNYKESWGCLRRDILPCHCREEGGGQETLPGRCNTWEEVTLQENDIGRHCSGLRQNWILFLSAFSIEPGMGHPARLLDHKPQTDQNPNHIASGLLLTRSSAFNYCK